MVDTNKWPKICTLMGCQNKHKAGHHHHRTHGHLSTHACTCSLTGEPGTKPKDEGLGGVLARSSVPPLTPNGSMLLNITTSPLELVPRDYPYVGERISRDGLVGV